MEEVRSASAQLGYVDVEKMIHKAALSFSSAKTQEELDTAWKTLVRPVYDQLSENALAILSNLYGLNLSVITNRLSR